MKHPQVNNKRVKAVRISGDKPKIHGQAMTISLLRIRISGVVGKGKEVTAAAATQIGVTGSKKL
jgi:hypothetical protein